MTMTNRRSFLMSVAGMAGAACMSRSAYAVSHQTRRPNVIIIYTDDQGSIDANCFGAKDLVTPAIDALADRGVRFTQFYAPSAICSPSRAGLLTGRYPLRAGMPGNCGSEKGTVGMPSSEVTIAEAFRQAGYATAHIGKWHLGHTPETMPNGQGFDYSFGHMVGCIDNYSHFFYWDGPNRHDLYRNGEEVHCEGRFFPDLMLEEASRFIEKHREEPFLLYYAMNNPHYPYQGDAKWLKEYQDKGTPYPRDLYAAFVSTLDERIGQLMDEVKKLDLLEDTIIVFQSDNGHSVEERAHFGGGDAGPYSGAKFSLFEGGIRVPAIISWPGHLPEGEVRDQVGHGCDWMPTLLELCDVEPPQCSLDGKSLVPVIRSASSPSPHDVLHWQIGAGEKAQWAVRQGDWKLLGHPFDPTRRIRLTDNDKLYLTNPSKEIDEARNLAAEFPDELARLKALHEKWLAGVQDEK